MPDGRFDLLVVGGGPGGYAAALYGASAGLRVALVEMSKVGGTCLHVGCIPAKHLLETAAAVRHVRSVAEFGVTTGPVGFDASVASRSRRAVTGKLFEGLSRLLRGRKVEVLGGRGRLLASGEGSGGNG
ncbi:MAG: hypothetical protein KatS3mg008_0564 [Acidimicrobiales bacterium]|nr:MAG: hypothetical protein KatS3mg008_0564 [Acidimicrobiales bacterium]